MSSLCDENFCIECCEELVALHAWPFSKVNVDQWLHNFAEDDRQYAIHMASKFIYLNDQFVDAQFYSAFQNLSNHLNLNWKRFDESRNDWNNFLRTCLIVPIKGESPNPSDSGYMFARKARQIIGIRENQLVDLDDAIIAMQDQCNRPIVFVDDFVGSGEQFIKTIDRKSRRANVKGDSIAGSMSRRPGTEVYYCNVTMTQKGKVRIEQEHDCVKLSSGNVLNEEYSWISENGRMWPEPHRSSGISFIEKYSKNLGYFDSNGSEDDWRGFNCLGLGLAFEHSTPDATLPFFFHENNGWKPLVTRR